MTISPPIVGSWNSKNSSLTNLTTRHDLPTAVSPRRTNLKWHTRLLIVVLSPSLLFLFSFFQKAMQHFFSRAQQAAKKRELFSLLVTNFGGIVLVLSSHRCVSFCFSIIYGYVHGTYSTECRLASPRLHPPPSMHRPQLANKCPIT